MEHRRDVRLAYLHSARVGAGGLGMCAATTLDDLARGSLRIAAYGPGLEAWPLLSPTPAVNWRTLQVSASGWRGRFTHRRWLQGRHIFLTNVDAGRAAAEAIAKGGADRCYAFSGV